MNRIDVCDDGDIWGGYPGERLYLSEAAHGHLEQSDFMVAFQLKEGEGNPKVIIQISLRLEHLEIV